MDKIVTRLSTQKAEGNKVLTNLSILPSAFCVSNHFFPTRRFLEDLNPLMWDDKKLLRHLAFLSHQIGTWRGPLESDDIWPRSPSESPFFPWSDEQVALYEDVVFKRKALHAQISLKAHSFAKRLL